MTAYLWTPLDREEHFSLKVYGDFKRFGSFLTQKQYVVVFFTKSCDRPLAPPPICVTTKNNHLFDVAPNLEDMIMRNNASGVTGSRYMRNYVVEEKGRL